MSGAAGLARDWLLLGVESYLASPENHPVDAHQGFAVHEDRWTTLRERLAEHRAAQHDTWKRLCGALGLDEPAYWLVMLTAATELYPEAAAAASILAEDERLQLLTPVAYARLLRAGLEADFTRTLAQAFPPGAARRLGLVELVEAAPGRPTTQQGLRLSASELTALVTEQELGAARSAEVNRLAPSQDIIFPSRLVVGAARLLTEKRVLLLRSVSARAGRQLALDIAGAEGQPAQFIAVTDSMPDVAELGRLRGHGMVVVDLQCWPAERAIPSRWIDALAATLPASLVLVAPQATTGALPALTVPPLGLTEARRVWRHVASSDADVEWLARRFRTNLEEARLALAEAADTVRVRGAAETPAREHVVEALLGQGSRRMGRAVSHIKLDVRLADLVVPKHLEARVSHIIDWYSTTTRVQSEYNLRPTQSGGGLACLFSGPPGTGKTFAAQCIASELGLNLYRIDLSQVVSKYIGETEKALAQMFDEAEAGHGVLLFDEADALFGKRTEVKDAHDRYANVEVGFLLQRMESFSGIAILTTNLRSNIDSAFVRRLQFVLEFPVPDRDRREQLWERSLPGRHQRRVDLDLGPFVERFKLSGGLIRNIGLAATHLAAATEDGLVGPEHVVQATFRELEKAGMARSASDFGPLADLLPRRAS